MRQGPQTNAATEFWIDVGGTFTDCVARLADGSLRTHKLLSSGIYRGMVGASSSAHCIVDPQRSNDPPRFFEGYSLILLSGPGDQGGAGAKAPEVLDRGVRVGGFDAARGRLELQRPLAVAPVAGMSYELTGGEASPVTGIRWLSGKRLHEDLGKIQVRLGTTRGTNALLEHDGVSPVFVTTQGFAEFLSIGDQSRPRLFDLNIRKPASLCRSAIEVEGRIDSAGRELVPLEESAARRKLQAARAGGATAVAVCLLNSYRNPDHERRVGRIAAALGFSVVSLSSDLSPLQGMLTRAETSVVDAFLTPVIRDYVNEIRDQLPEGSLKLMTSAGSLVDSEHYVARDSILSGPAAGVVGCVESALAAGVEKVIGFDMGGTSTDVSRYDGRYERRYELLIEDRETGGTTRVVAPMLAIETVAAGGGSLCDFDGLKPVVGPRSAGADPGPACYGRGGPLSVTDINYFLGRTRPENFPFPLDYDAVIIALDAMRRRIESATGRRYGREELAAGYLEIANAHMVGAIRKISVRRGYDPREYALSSFGGAGGQHACAIARELGIRKIVLPGYAGVLSAYGIGMAGISKFEARDIGRRLSDATLAEIESWFNGAEGRLAGQVRDELGKKWSATRTRRLLEIRYAGQDSTIMVEAPGDGDWRAAFERGHQQLYGFVLSDLEAEVSAARIEVASRTERPEAAAALPGGDTDDEPFTGQLFVQGAFRGAAVFHRAAMNPGDRIEGPALVLERTSTVFVEPGWRAVVGDRCDIILEVAESPATGGGSASSAESAADPITLELFNNHFADIADQMGTTLQKTALSTNVKNRLDFSCAIFDGSGNLVSHAPHIPVHLGAMERCVKCFIDDMGLQDGAAGVRPGEVFVTNDPFRGGTHLPDITVITPSFDPQGDGIVFFTASRAHHSEIGGVMPGSMSPRSGTLAEEGVLLRTMKLVDAAPGNGGPRQFLEDDLRGVLSAGPYPSRAVDQNVADLRAQAAANQCGVGLLDSMITRHGLARVKDYMGHIQAAAESRMRAAIGGLRDGTYAFEDAMDDGAALAVTIDIRGDEAVVDFSGTGPVHTGNLNATPAVVTSAVFYCFRCLVRADMPLNAGAMVPITIKLPECLLNPPRRGDPARLAAVAGGNVETSQRIVDCIFGALDTVAAAQGTMNNISFGNRQFGYYETIGGGAGAGPGFAGAAAVHSHMTNTRLTDPEVLEDRYPVRLRRFAIRHGSGGDGQWPGGDGIVRELEFLDSLEVSLLTQRRARRPYGLAGGSPGSPGRNLLRRASAPQSEFEELPAVCSLEVAPGDILRVETPGGGGYGRRRG